MIMQLSLGTALLLLSILAAGLGYVVVEGLMIRAQGWARQPPHRPRIVALLCLAMLAAMAQLTVSVWIWAVAFRAVGAFDTMEPSVYFALVTSTTLGFGDILLPEAWRLLGGLAAVPPS